MTQENQEPGTPRMPTAVEFILTRRLPCAALMLVMLMGAVWLPMLMQGMSPPLILLLTMLGLGIHMLVPALVALVTFGGGPVFAAQIAALAAAAVVLLADFALLPGLVVLLMYGLVPMLAAVAMMRPDGVQKSAEFTALAVGATTLLGLAVAAMIQDLGMRELIAAWLAPIFEGVEQLPGTEAEARQMLERAQQMMVAILPGLVAFGLWITWWGNIVLARQAARKYDFYRGDEADLLSLRLGRQVAYLFLAVLVLMNLNAGGLQYISANAAILIGGMVATQGIAVAHSWLKAKNMMFSIAMMYLMLIIWSVMIIPFVVLGLMDIWFDYRRKIPADGG